MSQPLAEALIEGKGATGQVGLHRFLERAGGDAQQRGRLQPQLMPLPAGLPLTTAAAAAIGGTAAPSP
jgi:hypothetical protein